MIEFTVDGNTKSTESFLEAMARGNYLAGFDALAQEGVEALQLATPKDSGLTAASWRYEIESKEGSVTIWWLNDNINDGFNVAIGLQYGHGTGNGGWIQGYDYINPAITPIFDLIADKVWKEVQNA